MKAQIRCGFGLGNRVTAIANGLTLFNSIEFVWKQNQHCPVDFTTIWPNGIPGVSFITKQDVRFATRHNGQVLHSCFTGLDTKKAYKVIFQSFAQKPTKQHDLAILLRLRRNPMELGKILKLIQPELNNHNPSSVFLLADSSRQELTKALQAIQINPTQPKSAELTSDLSRSAADFPNFITDWLTLIQAKHILAYPPQTSLVFPILHKTTKLSSP